MLPEKGERGSSFSGEAVRDTGKGCSTPSIHSTWTPDEDPFQFRAAIRSAFPEKNGRRRRTWGPVSQRSLPIEKNHHSKKRRKEERGNNARKKSFPARTTRSRSARARFEDDPKTVVETAITRKKLFRTGNSKTGTVSTVQGVPRNNNYDYDNEDHRVKETCSIFNSLPPSFFNQVYKVEEERTENDSRFRKSLNHCSHEERMLPFG